MAANAIPHRLNLSNTNNTPCTPALSSRGDRQPAGAVLGGGDVQAQDLPAPDGVHADRQQPADVDGALGLANLEHQRIGSQERGPGPMRCPDAQATLSKL